MPIRVTVSVNGELVQMDRAEREGLLTSPDPSMIADRESQGAVITGLSYRWNDAFITSLGYTQFFGHVYDQQGAYFPIAQYGSTEAYNRAVLGRGVAPVINHDQAEVRFRYTW